MSDHLRVNPVRCAAHGLCAEILPERVSLDDWGFPIVNEQPITPELTALSRRAITACPVFALRVEHQRPNAQPPTRNPRSGGSREHR